MISIPTMFFSGWSEWKIRPTQMRGLLKPRQKSKSSDAWNNYLWSQWLSENGSCTCTIYGNFNAKKWMKMDAIGGKSSNFGIITRSEKTRKDGLKGCARARCLLMPVDNTKGSGRTCDGFTSGRSIHSRNRYRVCNHIQSWPPKSCNWEYDSTISHSQRDTLRQRLQCAMKHHHV